MPTVNDRVVYRAIAGDCWDATVLTVRYLTADCTTRVNLSVMGPGLRKPIELYDVRWYDNPDAPFEGARPRRILDVEDDYADRAEWEARR